MREFFGFFILCAVATEAPSGLEINVSVLCALCRLLMKPTLKKAINSFYGTNKTGKKIKKIIVNEFAFFVAFFRLLAFVRAPVTNHHM